MKRVSGVVELMWTVELPDAFLTPIEKGAPDPAIEAVIDYLPQMGRVWFRGENEEPAQVYLEVHEEDFEVEDDDR